MSNPRIPNSVVKAAVEAVTSGAGVVTPEALVAAAADPLHPLHDLFEWRDDIAGHKHRLDQARTLIRSITYTIRTEDNKRITSVAYVHRPGDTEQGYIPLRAVERDKQQAEAVVMAELRRVEAALSRARVVAAALGLTDDLDELLADVGVTRAKVSGLHVGDAGEDRATA